MGQDSLSFHETMMFMLCCFVVVFMVDSMAEQNYRSAMACGASALFMLAFLTGD